MLRHLLSTSDLIGLLKKTYTIMKSGETAAKPFHDFLFIQLAIMTFRVALMFLF